MQLESCLLSRWRKLEGIKEGPSFSEHGYGLGGSPSYLLGDRKMSRQQSSVVMVTDRGLVSEHRAKLESMVNGREYTSYQCTCLRCFRNAVTRQQAVPKATVLYVKMLLGFPLGSLSLCSYSPRIPGCCLIVHQPVSLSTILPRLTST